MPRRLRRKSRLRTFMILLGISLMGIILPTRLTGGIRSIMQVFVPVQHLFTAMIAPQDVSAPEFTQQQMRELLKQQEVYRNQVASLYQRYQELSLRNKELAGYREAGLEGGRLIAARIVAGDAVAWRESKLLDRGLLRGVRAGDSVLSDYWVNTGHTEGIDVGMAIMAGEVLVGEVKQAFTQTSRVLLFTDPESRPLVVTITRVDTTAPVPPPDEFMLHGMGGGLMIIKDVDHRHIERGQIKVDDLVVASGRSSSLGVPMVVGQITELRRDEDNAALYNLIAEPLIEADRLKSVYIFDPRSAQ